MLMKKSISLLIILAMLLLILFGCAQNKPLGPGNDLPVQDLPFESDFSPANFSGLSHFGYFYNSGYKLKDGFDYPIANRIILFGYFFENKKWLEENLKKVDESTADKTNMYITMTSELEHNRWTGTDTDPQKSYCIPQGPDRERTKDIFRSMVERYDGDADYGCTINNGVDCYTTDDNLYPSATARENIHLNPIHNWQIENEIFDQFIECGYDPTADTYTFPIAPLDESERPSKEEVLRYLKEMSAVIKTANPNAIVVFPAFPQARSILFLDGRLDYYELDWYDCDYKTKITKEQLDDYLKQGKELPGGPARSREKIEYYIKEGRNYYDILDFHDYSNDPYINRAVMEWYTDLLGDNIKTKRVISTENSGPWNFFLFIDGAKQPNCTATKECQFERCNSQPYDEGVLSEFVIKRYAVGLSAGMNTIFWATLVELDIGFHDNFNRLGLIVDSDGPLQKGMEFKEKSAYYTYVLMLGKIYGYADAKEIQTDVYRFSFSNKESVYVAWSETGNRTVDLSNEINTSQVKVTYLVTELDYQNKPIYPSVETISPNSIPLTESPIFIEGIK